METEVTSTKPLGWLEIVGIAALSAIVFSIVPLAIDTFFPTLKFLSETLGHLTITIAAILIIRRIELPRIEQDRTVLVRAVRKEYDALIAQLRGSYEGLTQQLTGRSDELLTELTKKYDDSLPLLGSASALGIVRVHRSRKAAEEEIAQAIESTERDLLMLGVAFKETVSIDQRCGTVASLIGQRPDGADLTPEDRVRFLCLNPFTTPAVVRSFLESSVEHAREFLYLNKDDPSDPKDGPTAFMEHSPLFADWKTAFRNFCWLRDHRYPPNVRFYRRDPAMWMVVTDTRIFFEPYSFGRPPAQPGQPNPDLRMGGHMPVFEFDRSNRTVCAILENHFDRLWRISQDDLDTLAPYYNSPAEAAGKLRHDVWNPRHPLLETVVKVLEGGW